MPKNYTARSLHFPPRTALQAQPVRVVLFDVDGVLTDGGLYFSEAAKPSSAFTPWMAMASNCCTSGDCPGGRHGAGQRSIAPALAAIGCAHAVYGTEDKLPASAANFDTPWA